MIVWLISDDRNDHILGNFNQDKSLTSDERRYLAFKNSNIPLQPVDSLVSVVCSSSGVLSKAIVDFIKAQTFHESKLVIIFYLTH